MKNSTASRGASLVELLMVVVIGAIVVLTIGAPYIAGRRSFRMGMNQTQAQRDAHLAVRQMARAARSATAYAVIVGGTSVRINLTTDCGTISFEGGAAFNGGQLIQDNQCTGDIVAVADGNRSVVNNFAISSISPSLFGVTLDVRDAGGRNEILTTQIFLRNQ